jgi:ABC-type lipoprotein release transport system permease subunit
LTTDSTAAAHVLEYCVAILAMMLVTTLATYVPARRALTVDPAEILRAD